ncbi:heterokaryon incompatibility protein-domain-containing protein [Aspergillus tamarii]|uniref:Heterokaryon incompatibility protein-domain-containing protein n=1 Tax=Aspergillus tamarii TaxID=41984 RepID=A0A5N6VAN5_ASPTM|nr:heterokaryon incompatibility protein-domain-containing protein [Aspergillus tamarii]
MADPSLTYVMDDAGQAKPRYSLTEFKNGRLMRMQQAHFNEFERVTHQTLLMQTTEDHQSVVDFPHTRVGSTILSLATAQLPAASDTSHQVADEDLCSTCEDINIRALLGGLGSGRKYPLHDAGAIFSCHNCSLCYLLTQAFAIKTGKSPQEMTGLYSSYSIILTSFCSTFPMGSRQERKFQLCAQMLHPVRSLLEMDVCIRLLSDDASKLGQSPLFHGRLVPSEQADIGMARAWLSECEKNHDCSAAFQKIKRRSDANHHPLVIDVEQGCLCEIPPNSRYITLSYVWPRFDTTQLNKYNKESFMQPGAFRKPENHLPNVLRDAIKVAHGLGERYLWIDALCIVQDDQTVKSKLIEMMDKIYGEAALNIVVATAANPEHDYYIPGVGEPRTRRQVVSTVKGLRFLIAFPDYKGAIEQSRWATRGWTFQEGVLAQRCLVFHNNQMYFRCPKDARSEDVHAEGNKSYEFHPAKPRLRQSGVEQLLNPNFLINIRNGNPFIEYAQLVRDFSHRSLTFELDVINAFKGVMAVIEAFLPIRGMFCGLPLSLFDQALLWYPTSPTRRRLANDSTPAFPSWSWAGWVGSVDYQLDILHLGGNRIIYPMNEWYRYSTDDNALVCIPDRAPQNSSFALGLLYSHIKILRDNPSFIIAWVTSIRMTLNSEESHATHWLTDMMQSVPYFTIFDHEGDPCGFLPSANRDWARKFKKEGRRECELVLLCHAEQASQYGVGNHAATIHRKYQVVHNPHVCFYNVMLVEYHGDIAYRQGIGRVHKDAVHAINHSWESKILILG